MRLLNESLSMTAESGALTPEEIFAGLDRSISYKSFKKVLLIPPDLTRKHSQAGRLAEHLYGRFTAAGCEVNVLPALGSHVAMTESECADMFGAVPYERILRHDWRSSVERIGEVPGEIMAGLSGGELDYPVEVSINRELLDRSYEAIISIGQVVPHEVVGMANYTKNIVVGCGGSDVINASHILGAMHGLERLMGRDHSPVRDMLDYIEQNMLAALPLTYILSANDGDGICGLFAGRDRSVFESAVKLSAERNITYLSEPQKKVVVYLDPEEYRSTWIGNKAVYRTRMAIADGGELIILASGAERFGEDREVDRLIRKYGYRGRENIIARLRESDELKENLSAAAHLIHGSSDGRFTVTYCTEKLSREEIEGVGYSYMPYNEAVKLYNPAELEAGENLVGGEQIFYIPNPAVGLWTERKRFQEVAQ